jgi:hypothetical protein
MREISSSQTYFTKKIFPVIWFGGVVWIISRGVVYEAWKIEPIALVAPLFMLLIGVFAFRAYVWNLADKVFDDGDCLVVRKGSEEVRIALRDIVEVENKRMERTPRVTLHLRTPGKFGEKIDFLPKGIAFNPFAKHPLAVELAERVQRARSGK